MEKNTHGKNILEKKKTSQDIHGKNTKIPMAKISMEKKIFMEKKYPCRMKGK